MILGLPLKLHRLGLPLIVTGLLASCDTPQKRGLRELAKAGIEPTGSALLEAVKAKDSQRTEWLTDVGVFTEQCDAQGKTPLRISIENHDVASALKLLGHRANVNAAAPDQASILGIAVQTGETAIAEKLVAAGARTDGLMPDGEKILPWAIRHGRLTFVRAMMKSGADPHLKDRLGNPLLHVAMEAGRRDLMDSLIELGADPAGTNAAGETTIQVAFRQGWLDAVPKLAAAGADVNARGVDGLTLLDRAVTQGNIPHAVLLLKSGADPNVLPIAPSGNRVITPLERAFSQGGSAMLQAFLDQGVKPPTGNWDPWLWQAFRYRNVDAARALLSRGARATGTNRSGHSLIEFATLSRDATFVKLLTDYVNPPGNSLYFASARGDLAMTKLLLSCRAPANATRIPTLDTPLSAAIRAQQDELACMLLEGGAEPSLDLPEGQPLLHLAIATGCHRVVKKLLDAGADPNEPFAQPVSPEFLKCVPHGVMRWFLKNDTNVTPLMLAIDSGIIPSARHLIDAGAKKATWTRKTHTWPINFASRRADVKMMRLVLGRDPHNEERHIEIKLSEQRARIFDASGKVIYTTKVSTGKRGHATPTGTFVITDKNREWTSTIYHASMPYFQRLSSSDFGMHQGVVPNYPASHGCIRVPAGNAAKLFTLTQAGDRVMIVP